MVKHQSFHFLSGQSCGFFAYSKEVFPFFCKKFVSRTAAAAILFKGVTGGAVKHNGQ